MSNRPESGLSPAQRNELIQLLRTGASLAPEWRALLFPLKRKECELVYAEKSSEGSIFADTLALPLQPIRTFNKDESEWHNQLILGNNLQVLRKLLDEKAAGRLTCADGTPGVRTIYIDPPFATEREFSGNQAVVAYQDKVAGAEFLEFLRKRFYFLRDLLTEDGSIFLHLDSRKIHAAKLLMDEVFGEGRFQNEIIWQRTDPHNNAFNRLGKVHDTILWYSRADKPIYHYKDVVEALSTAATSEYSLLKLPNGKIVNWTPETDGKGKRLKLDDCTTPNANKARQFLWRGARPSAKRSWPADSPAKMDALVNKGILHLRNPQKGAARCKVSYLERREAEGQVLQDIWLNCGRMKGGSSYPTEKPEVLLDRIIRATTKEGDLVLDAFAGSGTTLAAAEKLKRRWIGIDVGKLAIYTIQRRLLNLVSKKGKSGKAIKASCFTLYHAGLYDFSKLKELPWDSWRFFALQLFQCRDAPHTIDGIAFDGYLKGASVMVINHLQMKGAAFSLETLEDLHAVVGEKIGKKVFIIAPSLSFGFQESCVVVDDVRYYALRIPYSLVDELHKQKFTALQQPMTKEAINDTIDSVGFDFIQTPELAYKVSFDQSQRGTWKCELVLKTFKSAATIRDPVNKSANLETLSMIMFDYDYKSEADLFELDQVIYGSELLNNNWTAPLSGLRSGSQIMAVFVDIYGNEAREIINVPEISKGGQS